MQVHPLKDTTAETVAKIIVDEWCCRLGIPESILSDGGKQYTSKLLSLIYLYLDVEQFKTTANLFIDSLRKILLTSHFNEKMHLLEKSFLNCVKLNNFQDGFIPVKV